MALLQTKFIAANAVDDSKLRLRNDHFLRARNFADTADISVLKIDASDHLSFNLVPYVSDDAVSGNQLPRLSQVQSLITSAGMVGGDMISIAAGVISVDLASAGGLSSTNPGDNSGQLQIKLDGSTLSLSSSGIKVNQISNSEIAAGAAIAYSKLNLSGSIANADISSAAAIALSKLAALASHNKVLVSDASGVISESSVSSTTLAFLDASSSIQTQLDNKLALAGGTMTGNITMGLNNISSSHVPTAGTDLVNKNYVDNALTGNSWKPAVDMFNLLGNLTVAAINALTPSSGDQYVVTDAGTLILGSVVVTAGSVVEFKNAAWILIGLGVGGFVDPETRAILGGMGGTIGAPYTDGVDNRKIVRFDGTSNTGIFTTDAVDKASILVQDYQSISQFDNSAYVFEGTTPTGHWIQFNGAGQIAAGVGLDKTGNTMSVKLGAGITELPTGDVGIDVRPNSGLDLVDPTSGLHSTAIDAQLSLKLDSTTLSMGASGLKVNQIADAQIATGAAIAFNKLANLTSAHILVGSSGNVPTDVAMSGDVSVDNLGATSIGSLKVTNAMLAGSIADSKLLQITTANKVAGSAVQLSSTGGLQNSTGLGIMLDGSTLSLSASGLKVNSITNSEVAAGAAIAYSKLNLSGSIVDADISSSAGIADSKLATISTAGKVSGSAVQLNASGALANSTGLKVNVDAVTTKINGSNALESLKAHEEQFTLAGSDITNQYVDLANVAFSTKCVRSFPVGGIAQLNGTDFIVSLTGGAAGKTRVTFAGDLATLLAAGDILVVQYSYL